MAVVSICLSSGLCELNLFLDFQYREESVVVSKQLITRCVIYYYGVELYLNACNDVVVDQVSTYI